MQFRTLALLLALAALAVFAAINWSAFTTPATLSLVFTTVEAPLGVVMLAVACAIAVLFLLFIAYLQTTVLLDARRHARELEASRALADQAEASRFTELRGYLEAELARLAAARAQGEANLVARIDRLDADLRAAIEQAGNTLAAYIGEVEDRLDARSAAVPRSPPRGGGG
jgi:uncharacterized integral membrane protein